jgi:uncharacterized repeat protein (TIGR03803 family)
MKKGTLKNQMTEKISAVLLTPCFRACSFLMLCVFGFAVSAGAAPLQVLHGQVPSGVKQLRSAGSLPDTNRLGLVISLPLRNQDALTNLLRQIYDPASPAYHHYLTPAQFTAQFSPTMDDYQALIAFAKSNGFVITGTHSNRTLLDVSGAVANIRQTFHVNLRLYPHPVENRNFYAPDTEPSLDLAVPVLAVNGLDNFNLPRPMGLVTNYLNQPLSAMPYSTGSGPRGNFIGRDFRAAYAPGVALNGSGQAVALFELDGYFPSDIAAYASLAGLPYVPLTNVLVDGFNQSPGSANDEVALDIDMAIAMAPGLSRVFVYEGITPDDVLNQMAMDNSARQLSCSWGFGPAVDPTREQIFQQFALQGQSFFQASGDVGAGSIYPPSDDPMVTVVGGTSLTTTNPGGAWQSESAWPDSSGGISGNYSIPVWQQGVNMTLNQGSTTMRNVPDVACLAVTVIWLIYNQGDQVVVGGTSAAAPLWAGFAALANQQAAMNGQPAIGFLNPALYATAESSAYPAAFHDITTGNNTNSSSPTAFFAVPGYDLCTGWGTPTGSNLINALVAPPDALQISPATILTFTATNHAAFMPATRTYSLTNDGPNSLNWVLISTSVWFNASPLSGALSSGGPAAMVTLTPAPVATNLPVGAYGATLLFSNLNDGFTQSRQVIFNVDALPVINLQPTNQSVFQGVTVNLTVGTTANATLSYQWRQGTGNALTNLTDGGNIFGSATSTLTLSNASPASAGTYSVVVSNSAGSVASSNAILSIVSSRPVIIAQPASQSVLPGQSVILRVTAVGSQPLYYQWQQNETNLVDGLGFTGSQTAGLTIINVNPAYAGTYSVAISNSLGNAASTGAVLTVVALTAPGVSAASLHSFTGGNDGANPNGFLQGTNGMLYGTTVNGGTNFAGTVFQLTANGLFGSLYSFTGGDDGANPFATLAQGPAGNFFGTTFQGGAGDNGTAFSLGSSGGLNNLLSFASTNGDLPYAGLTWDGIASFYGTTYQGGASGRGAIYRMTTNGDQTVLYSFSGGADGSQPIAGLLLGSDGNFYGTTWKGGNYGDGVVFKIATNGTFSMLLSFNGANGAFPAAGLVQDSLGNFYGVTSAGGAFNNGTIFRITPGGVVTNLYSFTGGGDGATPFATLVQGADGNFYGTTCFGGNYGDGTVFVLSPDGILTTLLEFDSYNGANPQAALAQASDGYFYGATANGGADGSGVIFRLGITSAPQITAQPIGQSVFAGANVQLSVAALGQPPLYYHWQKNGTNLTDSGTVAGSTNRILTLANVVTNDAAIYSVVVSNAFSFALSSNAQLSVTSSPPFIIVQPASQTAVAAATVVFGVTAQGNLPLIYQWQMNGTNLIDGGSISGSASNLLTLYNVTVADSGTYSVAVSNLLGGVISSNALLTVTSVSSNGTVLSVLHWFSTNGAAGGQTPNGLMAAADGNLYGTTQSGNAGGAAGPGTIFKLTTNGVVTTLISFSGTNGLTPGLTPQAALVEDMNGNFYGTTSDGGSNDFGNVFELSPGNFFTNLYSFTGTSDGAYPAEPLVLGNDGNLYGVTTNGGAFGKGNIFKLSPDGGFTNLYSFTGGADGNAPSGALLPDAGGDFYGFTFYGGAYSKGVFFKLPSSGTLTNLYSFTGGMDGFLPVGAPVFGDDGSLYGVTEHNTIHGFLFYGTIFKSTTNGALTTLYALNFTDGARPLAGLIQGSDGNFYGTTYTGAYASNGSVFRITPSGVPMDLVIFDGFDDGAHPQSSLVEGADGALYGTAATGGPGGGGTIFRLSFTTAPQITSQPANQTVFAGGHTTFSVASFGAPQLVYQWLKNGTNLANGGSVSGSTARVLTLTNVRLADEGIYSAIVSNSLGSVTSSNALLTVIPSPAFQTTSQANGAITLVWSTVSGQQYQVQSNTNLHSSAWISLGPVFLATNGVSTYSDIISSGTQKFYRVVLLP